MNKLTSLTGFGEGDPKPEKAKYEVKPRLHSGSVKNPFYKVKNSAKSKALSGKLDKASGARDVTKAYKKAHPDSRVHGVHDILRK